MLEHHRVVLRDERSGLDRRVLSVYIDQKGNLVIEGQDLGPRTAPVSSDGEYEWFRTIRKQDLPRLLLALGGEPEADLLGLLKTRWSGEASYELEQTIADAGIPSELHVWSG